MAADGAGSEVRWYAAAAAGVAAACPVAASAGAPAALDPPTYGVMLGLAALCIVLVVVLYERRLARLAAARSAALAALQTAREEQAIAAERRARHFTLLSTEARTRLGALHEALDLVAGGRLDESRRLYLTLLLQSARRLSAQFEHVVDYDRIDQGRVALRPERTDVVELIRAVALPMAEVAADRRLAYALFVPQHPFPALGVDGLRLQQVVGNLLHNALAHTVQGEVRVELRYRHAAAHGGSAWLSVTVHDTGPGLDAAARERLSAALERDRREQGPGDGLGLALWIASRLARLLGGSLTVHSERGRGSDFVLRVPVRVHDDAGSRGGLLEDLTAGFVRPAIPPGGATRGRLLLVEDDRVVQFTLANQLRGIGFDVVCADDAEEAIEAWRGEPFERVLTDLGLPGRDGVELIAAIRESERTRGLPWARIVVCTGEPAHAARARAAGADAVLIKPVGAPALARALDPAGDAGAGDRTQGAGDTCPAPLAGTGPRIHPGRFSDPTVGES